MKLYLFASKASNNSVNRTTASLRAAVSGYVQRWAAKE